LFIVKRWRWGLPYLGIPAQRPEYDRSETFRHRRLAHHIIIKADQRTRGGRPVNPSARKINHKIHRYHFPFLHWKRKGTDESPTWLLQGLLALARVARLYVAKWICYPLQRSLHCCHSVPGFCMSSCHTVPCGGLVVDID
jgi:hypothetical protein